MARSSPSLVAEPGTQSATSKYTGERIKRYNTGVKLDCLLESPGPDPNDSGFTALEGNGIQVFNVLPKSGIVATHTHTKVEKMGKKT